ncbi:MAG TPA: glycoside hydrolase family 28 protein [Candidatus Fimivivens sp.]|nr:glycoside hydrolase family 28 protein [Candidatus Fimivivens sp.]
MKRNPVLSGIVCLSTVVAFVTLFGVEYISMPAAESVTFDDGTDRSRSVDIFESETAFGKQIPFRSIRQPVTPDRVCDITDYGAIGDGSVKNTAAFGKAIDDCAANGGGHVTVPRGRWLTGPIRFRSNIDLHLEKDAEILFSTDLSDYLPIALSRYDGVEYYNYVSLVHADKCRNISITGEGTLNGMGQEFWWKTFSNKGETKIFKMGAAGAPLSDRIFGNTSDGLRPSFIEFTDSRNILIEGVTVRNSPRWTIHPLYSDDIIIRNITIATSPGRNTDGIAIDSSRNVLVENATVSSGDDAITIKSGRDRDGLRVGMPSENVVIRNCHVRDGHGAITIGSEVSGGIRNVLVYDIDADLTDFGFRIKSSTGRGGSVANVRVRNMHVGRTLKNAVQITMDYDAQFSPSNTALTDIRDIEIDTLDSRQSGDSVEIIGNAAKPIVNVSLANMRIRSKNGVIVRNADHVSLRDITVRNAAGIVQAVRISDSNGVTLTDVACPSGAVPCLELHGERTGGISLGNGTVLPSQIRFLDGAKSDAVTTE